MLTDVKHIFIRVQAYHLPVRVILGRNGLGCTCLDVRTLLERYPLPGQTTGKAPLVKHRVKQLRELLLERNWPVCWACIKRMENQVGPIHHGWARVGAELWARKSIGTTSLLAGTFRHNNAIYHISFFSPRSLSRVHGKIIYKALFDAPWFNQL